MEPSFIKNDPNNYRPAEDSPYILHKINGYISNIFLLEYQQGMLLFDCGAINDVKRIENYCHTDLKRSPAEIKLAVVSHIHPDHSGGAVVLRKKYGIPIAAHKDLDRWYAGMGGSIQQKLDCYMMQIVAYHNQRKLEKSLFDRTIKPDYLLNDGDELPMFNDWKVVHVPGHTLHDIVLFNAQASILYAADCILDIKGKFQLPLPVVFPNQMRQSYAKLAALNAASILLAHGETILTQSSAALFTSMQLQLDRPPNKMTRRVRRLSIYSPEVWTNIIRGKKSC